MKFLKTSLFLACFLVGNIQAGGEHAIGEMLPKGMDPKSNNSFSFSKNNSFAENEMVVVDNNNGYRYGIVQKKLTFADPTYGKQYMIETLSEGEPFDITRRNIFPAAKIGKINK